MFIDNFNCKTLANIFLETQDSNKHQKWKQGLQNYKENHETFGKQRATRQPAMHSEVNEAFDKQIKNQQSKRGFTNHRQKKIILKENIAVQ